MKLVAVWFLLGVLPCSGFAQERAFVTNSRMILGAPEDLTASVTFVDVDGDSDLDAVYANGRHWAQLNEVYLNNGAGQFTVGYALGPEKATTYAVPAGDLDGDGDTDIVVGNDRAENWVYLNDGKGRFTLAWAVGPEIEPTRSAQLYDLDGDGSLDVLVTNRGAANGFYLNDGTGRFEEGVPFGDSERSYAVVTADLDRDGDYDIIVANVAGRNAVYLNDGSAQHWAVHWLGDEANTSYGVDADDLNGDGYPEIGFANSGAFNRLFRNVAAQSRGNE